MSAQHFGIASRATDDAVWDWDLVRNTLWWNESFVSLFGYPGEEMEPGMDAKTRRIHPEDLKRVTDGIHAVIGGTGSTWSDEYRFLRCDGTYADILDRGFVIRDASGRALRITGAMRDVTDRKAKQDAIRQSEKLLRDMIDGLGSSMYIGLLKPDGTLVKVNQPALAITGLKSEDFLGMSIDETYAWSYSEKVRREIREAVRRAACGESSRYDVDNRITENRFITLDFSLHPIRDVTGKVVLIVASGIDITERKRAERNLLESEERYRLAIKGSSAGIWDWKPLTHEVSYAPRIAEILGLSMDELPVTFEAFEERIHPQDRAAMKAALQAHFQDRKPYNVEYRMRTKSGEYRWLNAQGQALWDESGRACRMSGSLIDIQDRKTAEQALAQTTELLKRTNEIARVGGFELDVATMKMHFTEELYRILEFDPDKPLSLASVVETVAPEARSAVEAEIRAAISKGAPLHLEYPIITGKGRSLWVQSRITSVLENGKVVRRVGALQDITDRKQAEIALHKINAELERRVLDRTAELAAKNKELATFSYSVSHDLKAPLRGIDGYSKFLLEDYADKLDEQGRLFLANIRAGAAQMHQLIEDMLAYSRLERRTLASSRLDLRKSVEAVLRERPLDLEGVSLTVDMEPDTILADQEGMMLSLRNLIDNAIKFSRRRKPPIIEIRSRIEGDRHVLSVRDNGTGFEMKHHDTIFQIFKRLHRAEEFPGTGIGLAMVRKAMDRMGGRVWAESEPDHGAVFHLDFPRAQ